jgi:hypothetical protein
MRNLTLNRIKTEMLKHKDFFGGDIMYTDEIKAAKNRKELAKIMDKYRKHLEDMAVDAQAHHDDFKEKLGLNLI